MEIISRGRLAARLIATTEQVRGLERQHTEIVAAAQGSNGDDEHDPEGATIGFERQQLAALLAQAVHTRGEIMQGLDRLDEGLYGVCEVCQSRIDFERLEVRPAARTCIACATLRR